MRVGIEIGGTFTDLICIDGGHVRVTKVPSTPSQPEQGFANALDVAGINPSQIEELAHGSTVATNAVLERKGSRVLLITTRGFRDVLWIQRQNRARSYELVYRKPEPVLSRRAVVEIDERVGADGSVVDPLDESKARQQVRDAILDCDPEVVAIAFLNSYVNPAHELAIKALVTELSPHLGVMCSHEISPEFREYERFSTTTLSAYVQPVIARYLEGIQNGLKQGGFPGQVSLMQSNGGRLPARAMQKNPVTALYSGPAAGVAGANLLATQAGRKDIITFDMGGTSADVCLIADNKPALKSGTSIGGLPVRSPVLDISTVGAGGGSHIWRDDGGMLRVGPTSAGAMPGPAAYGRGGTLPTITDAHVVCGTLRPDRFLGGKASLDLKAARSVFADLARAFNCSVEEVADSAIRVANANIVRAIQSVSTEVGKDPRQFALMAFGGAGPLHAGRIAEQLGATEVLLPRHAGVLSALGLLASQFTVFETATKKVPVNEEINTALRAVLDGLEASARRRLNDSGVEGEFSAEYTLQMRYTGQAFELDVPLAAADLASVDEEQLRQAYEQAVAGQMNFRPSGRRPIEVVGFRCSLTANTSVLGETEMGEAVSDVPDSVCQILEGREERECRIVSWPAPGQAVTGPAIVDAQTSTMYVPPAWTARLNEKSNSLIMTRDEAKK